MGTDSISRHESMRAKRVTSLMKFAKMADSDGVYHSDRGISEMKLVMAGGIIGDALDSIREHLPTLSDLQCGTSSQEGADALHSVLVFVDEVKRAKDLIEMIDRDIMLGLLMSLDDPLVKLRRSKRGWAEDY